MPDFKGRIAVALNVIHGPDSLALSTAERDSLIQDAVAGLDLVRDLEPRAEVSYIVNLEEIQLDSGSSIWVRPSASQWNGWPAGWTGVDAVVRHPNGKLYFFRGDEYARYTVGDGFDQAYPRNIAGGWSGWPSDWYQSGVDAAVAHPNGNVYFFRGDQYLRHVPGEGVDATKYPRKIADTWTNWPDSWTSVDAAMFPKTTDNDRLYFFRGDEYLRYITGGGDTGGVSSGFPKKIAGGGQGNLPFIPMAFGSDLNAAVGLDDGRIYFFKGSDYCRYPGFGYEAFERHWRDPANESLGFADHRAQAADLKTTFDADAAVVTYITNYPVWWWGYAGSGRHVIHTQVQKWDSTTGTDDMLPFVYAHETLHLFGAADEYSKTKDCDDLHGTLGVPNRNSEDCRGAQLSCLMDGNDAELCAWSRLQIGWNYGLDQIDAAVEVDPDRMYFFGDSRYVRYWPEDRGQAEPRYPRATSSHWTGWPAGWSQVDAVVKHPNGKLYFFREGEYFRYTPGDGVDGGYPKPIRQAWSGWPDSWYQTGVDAAIRHPNGNIYFFKGPEYLRHVPGEGVDANRYPRRTADTWDRWPDSWSSIDAAVFRSWNDKLYFFRGDEYLRYTPGDGVDGGYPQNTRQWWGSLLKW